MENVVVFMLIIKQLICICSNFPQWQNLVELFKYIFFLPLLSNLFCALLYCMQKEMNDEMSDFHQSLNILKQRKCDLENMASHIEVITGLCSSIN